MSRYKLVARDYFGKLINGDYKLILVPGWKFKLLRYKVKEFLSDFKVLNLSIQARYIGR